MEDSMRRAITILATAPFLATTLYMATGAAGLKAETDIEVLDAETLRVGAGLYRLEGIDAPEPEQACWLTSHLFPCGEIARGALLDLTAGADVICVALDETKDGATASPRLARCHADGYNLSEGMTYTGWALADRRSGQNYRRSEAGAAANKRGLWRGRFVKPWDWRAGERLPEEQE